MASKQIQCEICFKEYAVGYCKTCGHIGDACVDIHNTGKVFQTHSVIMHEAVNVHEDDRENPKVIIRDASEERCKQHATERAIFLCTRHDTMICGRCLHSEHLSCGKEVVDLLREVGSIDCEKVNTMKSLLMEVKNEILLLKDDAENSKENFKTNADNCAQECIELGIKIKQRVDELTNVLIDEITKKHNENESTYSRITRTYNEKITWCENEERKIDQFVHNNMAGYLYLLSRKFDKGVSDVRSNLREIKHKHTFKRFEFKENRVILKCVFEDLEDVCEHQDEVTGSDDGSVNDVFEPTTEIQKTRRELTALSHKAKEYLDKSIKERLTVEAELKRTKADLNRVEKEIIDN
ncbi:uncharacterized protein LOC128206992 [Mya arenaria]|uniref:uncharacterized protein LOC128206992 n=1 Tax=Mya arenaria TaxID=6604 RepID=UPI0022E0D713|nr:uncharacterized protein LOC128206992 [Mya arenaria]